MQAMVTTGPEAARELNLQELPDPLLQRDTDLLVRVKAAGINPVDIKMRNKPGVYPAPIPPVLGCDGAGIIEATGLAVKNFKKGDEIYYCQSPAHDRLGNYAQYALVDYRLAAKKPTSMSFEQAAAAPLVLITAWEALHDRAHIQPGDKVLIHAGAGGVGHVAIQLARVAGAQVCTTLGAREKIEFVTLFGANKTILYKEENFVKAALDWSDGQGMDMAFDTVGGKTFSDTFSAVRYFGDVVSLLMPGADTDWNTARTRNLRVSFELMLIPVFYKLLDAMQHQGEILKRCAELIDQKKLWVHVDTILPLARAAEAHALLASGKTKGKVVLTVD